MQAWHDMVRPACFNILLGPAGNLRGERKGLEAIQRVFYSLPVSKHCHVRTGIVSILPIPRKHAALAYVAAPPVSHKGHGFCYIPPSSCSLKYFLKF